MHLAALVVAAVALDGERDARLAQRLQVVVEVRAGAEQHRAAAPAGPLAPRELVARRAAADPARGRRPRASRERGDRRALRSAGDPALDGPAPGPPSRGRSGSATQRLEARLHAALGLHPTGDDALDLREDRRRRAAVDREAKRRRRRRAPARGSRRRRRGRRSASRRSTASDRRRGRGPGRSLRGPFEGEAARRSRTGPDPCPGTRRRGAGRSCGARPRRRRAASRAARCAAPRSVAKGTRPSARSRPFTARSSAAELRGAPARAAAGRGSPRGGAADAGGEPPPRAASAAAPSRSASLLVKSPLRPGAEPIQPVVAPGRADERCERREAFRHRSPPRSAAARASRAPSSTAWAFWLRGSDASLPPSARHEPAQRERELRRAASLRAPVYAPPRRRAPAARPSSTRRKRPASSSAALASSRQRRARSLSPPAAKASARRAPRAPRARCAAARRRRRPPRSAGAEPPRAGCAASRRRQKAWIDWTTSWSRAATRLARPRGARGLGRAAPRAAARSGSSPRLDLAKRAADALLHLGGGRLGEGDRHDPRRARARAICLVVAPRRVRAERLRRALPARAEAPGDDAADEHRGLAGAGAGLEHEAARRSGAAPPRARPAIGVDQRGAHF